MGGSFFNIMLVEAETHGIQQMMLVIFSLHPQGRESFVLDLGLPQNPGHGATGRMECADFPTIPPEPTARFVRNGLVVVLSRPFFSLFSPDF